MKKHLACFLCAPLLLAGCAAERGETHGALPKAGVAPYELSEDQQLLLASLGMADTARLISFSAPKEAVTVEVNAYRLAPSGTWETAGNGAMSIGTEREPSSPFAGTVALILGENYSIDFHINCMGQGSFSSEEIALDEEPVGSTQGYLEEFQEIGLNQEIPVAVLVYDSGTSMRSYTPEDYFEPSVFEGMDLVQAVTVSFSGREIGE